MIKKTEEKKTVLEWLQADENASQTFTRRSGIMRNRLGVSIDRPRHMWNS